MALEVLIRSPFATGRIPTTRCQSWLQKPSHIGERQSQDPEELYGCYTAMETSTEFAPNSNFKEFMKTTSNTKHKGCGTAVVLKWINRLLHDLKAAFAA
eukprot:5872367-Amphidinium_carterae.1